MGWFFAKRRHVTLVLGGGSARGIAHIGVIKVLERERIPIDTIVGTSIGALVGAAYSVGIPIGRLEEKAYRFSWEMLFDPTLPVMGFVAGEKLEHAIKDIIEDKEFGDCRIPTVIVTTDIEKNEEISFRSGDLTKVLRASCSWPGIFNPVKIDSRLLVDGGVKNSVPTKIARSGKADYVIAADVGFCVKHGTIENVIQMMLQTFQIMGQELNRYQARQADCLITVDLGDIDQFAFHRSREAVAKGIEAAEAQIGRIKRDLRLK